MARILIIDDEASIRELFLNMLTQEGYDVVEASDGNAGMKLFRDNPSDVVITDLIMPDKEGIETIMELRRDFPDVKIIAISGGGVVHAEEYLRMARGVGADRVFKKPFDVPEMLDAVSELLEQSGSKDKRR